MTILKRVEKLRELMQQKGLHAYLVPNTDPHQSEYISPRFQQLEFLSGFSGSAGNLVVTENFAGLWTDSRYFLQAEVQLEGSGITLMKLRIPHTPEYIDWIAEHLDAGQALGMDASLVSVDLHRKLRKQLSSKNIELQSETGMLDELWSDRPALPEAAVFDFALRYAGASRSEKLAAVREKMAKKGASHHLITTLDDIAWLLNLRGSDIDYNPVFLSFLLMDGDQVQLFAGEEKLPRELIANLRTDGIHTKPYEDIGKALAALPDGARLLLQQNKINLQLEQQIPAAVKRIQSLNPSSLLKCIKNETEIANTREAMARDGVAMVKFIRWIENHVGKQGISETDASDKLLSFRQEQEDFVGQSFGPISGYAGNGAIVHYSADPASAAELRAEGLYLIDSGGQYLDGTTDITRTLALGTPTAQMKADYTRVLKGHIALGTAIFPEGTKGFNLDVLARQFLWQASQNYGHGTGHGVGFFLNVHEGPQSISQAPNADPSAILRVGMITSNEPGLYRSGEYGIRIENLVLCVPHSESDAGTFLAFEELTMCPIDTRLIDMELMTGAEISWLNRYHQRVYDALSPRLEGEELDWLRERTNKV